jgi:hypothetical protein
MGQFWRAPKRYRQATSEFNQPAHISQNARQFVCSTNSCSEPFKQRVFRDNFRVPTIRELSVKRGWRELTVSQRQDGGARRGSKQNADWPSLLRHRAGADRANDFEVFTIAYCGMS